MSTIRRARRERRRYESSLLRMLLPERVLRK